MKKLTFMLTAIALLGTGITRGQSQTYFTSQPSLSPDGATVFFCYEGDIWKVPAAGGEANRITAMPGNEINPKISPDGKWLAFSSDQFGNYDVYVMPTAGGSIRQLTHHDAADELENWSWDSKTLYFTSNRYNNHTAYKVDVNGGTSQRVFDHYFNTINNIAEAPDGKLYFNDTWESKNFASRKRYKGAYNPDILSYDIKNKQFKKHTDYLGKDMWTSINKAGKVYFVSDEHNNEYNLYTFSGDRKTQLTKFETSIKRPSVAANGSKVVFEKDYQLFIFDVVSKSTNPVKVNISRNLVLEKDQEFNVRSGISDFDASPDGKKLAFVSRGELFISDAEGKFIRKITRNSGGITERAMQVMWLADNRTVVFNQTSNGYLNWFSVSADGSGNLKQLTRDNRNNRDLTMNKARTSAVYISGRDEVRIMDLKTMASKTIVKDEIWGFSNSTPTFSPNNEYVLFTAFRNMEQDIFVHHIRNNKTINLTNTGITESAPFWSPDGKYIYFASNRTKPSFPTGAQNAHIYRMALGRYDQPYRTEKFDELFTQSKPTPETKPAPAKKAGKEADKKKADTITKKPVETPIKPIVIQVEDIMDRIEQVGPSFGTQSNPVVLAKGTKTFVFFNSNHEGGSTALYRAIYEPFEAVKTEKVTDGYGGGIAEASGKYYLLLRGAIHKYNIDMNRIDRMDMDYKFRRNLNDEFNQMFYETWAGLEENFYDEKFHGLDWTKMKERYAAYLPHINSRADLRALLSDLLGELNSSHLGFNSSGIEERKGLNYVTNETGIVFSNDDPYKVEKVTKKSNADKLEVDVKSGDVLIAVNGEEVDIEKDRDFYFTKPSLEEEMTLTFKRAGKNVQVNIHPQSAAAFKDNLYDEWITDNRKRVAMLSDDKIAYSYMKNMSGDQLENFLLDMVAQENKKDAIILDLRYNTGGNVHDEVLNFLARRPYLHIKYREGKLSPQGAFGPSGKPIVLLINEQSLSDAEMTAAGFKALKLGKIIGTETYRWIIFTSAKGLVDGSSYRVPAWGCYTLDGKDLELNGVSPDIQVNTTFMNRLNGEDPQLQRAVDEILKDLKK